VLSPQHLAELRQSGISDAQFGARGYLTMMNGRALPQLFNTTQHRLHGLLIPVWNTRGEISNYQLKPDNLRSTDDGKPNKYETAANGRICLDVPTAARPLLHDAEAPLWITEGAKKVDAAVSNGISCTIGLLGVWMWRGEKRTLRDWDDIWLKNREVIIAFDSDVMTKASVRGALEALTSTLTYLGARVRYCLLPDLPDGRKCGLDDFLVSGHTRADLEALVVDSLPAGDGDWEEPIPFDDPTGPPFRLLALPPRLREYAEAVAGDTGAQEDLAAAPETDLPDRLEREQRCVVTMFGLTTTGASRHGE
jgi:hypothetical protein